MTILNSKSQSKVSGGAAGTSQAKGGKLMAPNEFVTPKSQAVDARRKSTEVRTRG